MTAAKYPRRTIALGPPYDDDTVPSAPNERPADLSGKTPTVQRALAADASGEARPSNQPSREPTTDWRKEAGLRGIDNEVLRDLLEVAWSTIAVLSADHGNPAAEALRARIWAHLHDEEAACPNCDHYVVNHGAAGPCAVYECECQDNALAALSEAKP